MGTVLHSNPSGAALPMPWHETPYKPHSHQPQAPSPLRQTLYPARRVPQDPGGMAGLDHSALG